MKNPERRIWLPIPKTLKHSTLHPWNHTQLCQRDDSTLPITRLIVLVLAG